MKVKKLISKSLSVLSILLIISSCSKKEESPNPVGNNYTNNPTVPENKYTPPPVSFSTTVSGFVQDLNGDPVQNALVSTGSKTFTTDENGAFELVDAPFTGDFCYIKAQKSGFFTASTTVHGKAGTDYTTQLVMVPQNNIQSFKATEAKTITLPSGAKVDFPASAIKKLDGTPYTGQVNVAVKHIDPSDPDFSLIIPGGDLRAFSAEGNEVQLYSYGMLNVELRDDAGNYLQLADGKTATLSMPVPTDMQNTALETISLWYFDENKGIWIEEGEAKLKNGEYIGTVSHFTPWNCDWQGPRAFIKGILTDCEGEILGNVSVRIGQITLNTNENGEWECWVPAGIDIEIMQYNFDWRKKGEVIITAPKLTEGQTYDVGKISIKCVTTIMATISDCDDKPFKGYVILKVGSGEIRTYTTNGIFKQLLYANENEKAELFFHNPSAGQLSKMDITTPKSEKKLNLGKIKACPPTSVTPKFSFDYDDGSGIKSVSFDDITMAQGTYYSSADFLQLSYQAKDNQNVVQTANFTIWSPKLGTIPPNGDSTLYMQTSVNEVFYDDGITIKIDKYDGQGGEISGTFSGNMTKYTNQVPKSVAITNGKFTVLRLPNR